MTDVDTSRWAGLTKLQRVNLVLIALVMAVSGIGHFVLTDGYVQIVPPWVPAPRATVYVSGIAELMCAGLLSHHRTRRIGAWATIALLVSVYPANIWVVVEGDGYPFGDGFAGTPAFAWLRLPFQALFIWWAWTLTRDRIRG